MTYALPQAVRSRARSWRAVADRARLRLRARLSPQTVDALFAAAVCALLTGAMHRVLHPFLGQPLLFNALLTLPLVWRRRAPLGAFLAMSAVAFVQWCLNLRTPTDMTLLIALYTVAAHASKRHTWLAVGVLETGALLASVRWSTPERVVESFVGLSAMAVAASVIGMNMRSRRAHLAFLEERAVRLERERDQQSQLAVAGERARIAREMHDIVTHNLSVMVALADGAVFAQELHPERATAAMRQVSTTGRQAITDMRRFLGVLRADEPDALRHPMPGIAQLEPLADQVRAAGLPTRLDVSGDPSAVPVPAQLTVYRLVQEALTNTLKHTPPGTRAEVRVRCAAQHVTVRITDDGPVAELPDRTGGQGLHGMRERAAVYGGEFEAGPRHDGGWQVRAVLALSGNEA
ncbi:sensor histidine kinase [Streptomyces fuscichromogenes]|uniref:histidine kinase n=1 Tax=Streptomyces fuscichromogenes TaxID=1324013 RepID=A0A917XHP3_9ACTN|nr:histidine kinase [Streptomyces fuscichromogenes]GGN25579.1 two-component sensor histidine kinase [Streptomyces fuscichromogenes]